MIRALLKMQVHKLCHKDGMLGNKQSIINIFGSKQRSSDHEQTLDLTASACVGRFSQDL